MWRQCVFRALCPHIEVSWRRQDRVSKVDCFTELPCISYPVSLLISLRNDIANEQRASNRERSLPHNATRNQNSSYFALSHQPKIIEQKVIEQYAVRERLHRFNVGHCASEAACSKASMLRNIPATAFKKANEGLLAAGASSSAADR